MKNLLKPLQSRKKSALYSLLSEHTEEILGDILHLSDIEISNLFDKGVVASPTYNKK